jgi:KDO2-lipid IV(A) lauroyltransferase
MAKKRRRRRGRKIWGQQTVEYLGVLLGILIIRATPMWLGRFVARRVGDCFYYLFPRRRAIARKNLSIAFPQLKDEKEIRRIIHGACQSLMLTVLEMVKLRSVFERPDAMELIAPTVPAFHEKVETMKRLHAETGGFITVLPHLGNWEILLHVADVIGIPNVIVVRPLDNPMMEKLLYRYRTDSQQEFVPKHNVFFTLKNALRRGKCVAVLGDQRAGRRGVMAPFFGQPVSTHRTPAMLAYQFDRPIVVVAACRTPTGFEGYVSEPIQPRPEAAEDEEVLRLTTAVNEQMAEFIRRHPDQYLWAHDRWKNAIGNAGSPE